jgi:O-acetyl-ADP-ribose deacetylase (regulator of RNase III)
MIEFAQGDILKADAEALVNTVNCVGIMGRGIALQFRKAFPENFKVYKAVCDAGQVKPGTIFVHDLNRISNPRFIINFPTKRHWKSNSRIEDIQLGLKDLITVVQKHKIRLIAIPPLGYGLGGLNWQEVRPLVTQAFQILPDVTVLLFEPTGAPKAAAMLKPAKLHCLLRKHASQSNHQHYPQNRQPIYLNLV